MSTGTIIDDFAADFTTTGRLVPGEDAVSGNLEQSFDRDWFALEIVEGQIYNISIDASGISGSWSVRLIDSEGSTIPIPTRTSNVDTDVIAFQAEFTGTIYLDIASTGVRGSLGGTGDYAITTTISDPDEAGNSLQEATHLNIGEQLDGGITYFGDTDFYAIDIVEGKDYNLSFSSSDADLDQYVVTIYDHDGNALDTIRGSSLSQNYLAEYTGQAFVSVEIVSLFNGPFSSDRDDDIGDYQLRVQEDADGTNFTAGSNERDLIIGSVNGENIFGGDGGDTIIASQGADFVDGGAGVDLLSYIESQQGIKLYADLRPGEGGAAGDSFVNIEQLTGSQFDDVITAGGDLSTVFGAQGNDIISMLTGQTAIFSGGEGNDVLNGANLNDRLDGNSGNDLLIGQSGDDSLNGGEGSDMLYGNAGADLLIGDRGADLIYGGAGDDEIIGDRRFIPSTTGETDDHLYGNAGDDTISGQSGDDFLYGGTGNDLLDGGTGNDVLYGGSGADTLDGFFGDDKLFGGADNDFLEGNTGDDQLYGGSGNDIIYGELQNLEDLSSGGESQTLSDRLQGGAGDDMLYGQIGNDVLVGGTGNDLLDGGSQNDRLFGGEGKDTLLGASGNDVLRGGDGADVLNGGVGNDILYGDAGADTFVLEQLTPGLGTNSDQIVDFNSAEGDTINVEAFGLADFGELQGLMTEVNGHVRIRFDDGSTVLIRNTEMENLTAADFGLPDAPAFIEGTTGNDVLTGSNINNVFFGDAGDDIIDGNGGDYNQADYYGSINDYAIFANEDGSITVSHATLGTDTLTDIDGFWFGGDAQWYSLHDAIDATLNDFMV